MFSELQFIAEKVSFGTNSAIPELMDVIVRRFKRKIELDSFTHPPTVWREGGCLELLIKDLAPEGAATDIFRSRA
jgi:hypothetical protein